MQPQVAAAAWPIWYSWHRCNGWISSGYEQMHCLPWSDFESFSEHLGPCITPAPPPSSQLAPGLPQGHSSSMGAEGPRAELPKKKRSPFCHVSWQGIICQPISTRLQSAKSWAGHCCHCYHEQIYCYPPWLLPCEGPPDNIFFNRKEQKGLMERTWQGSGLLLSSTDSLKLMFPLGWLTTCKIKWHHTRSLYLIGLHTELSPCSPADNDPSPISDFASHGYPKQRATKREGLINQRSPLLPPSRTGIYNLKSRLAFYVHIRGYTLYKDSQSRPHASLNIR